MARVGLVRVGELAPAWKRVVLAGFDLSAWVVAVVVADVARDRLVPRLPGVGAVALGAGFALVAQLLIGWLLGLYRGYRRVGSFEEAYTIGESTVCVAVALALFTLVAGRPVPLSVPLLAGPIALVLSMASRCGIRSEMARRRRPDAAHSTRLLVFGAGEGGSGVIRTMLRDPNSPYLPVGILDDDPHKRHLSLMGVPVVGTRTDLARAATELSASAVLIAIPSAPAELIREVTDQGSSSGLDVKVLPSLRESLDGGSRLDGIRSPTIADLLGRREVGVELATAAGYLTGRRVLVTGAGGSIGSELCRQIDRLGPAELIMVDRDESALHAVQMSIGGRALLDSPNVVVIDLRDHRAVGQLFAARRPEVVFHAAALKHLPALEMYPGEAVKTNVWGTMHVLEAAAAVGVERFVNVSTDKAANPTSALGYSKRIGERLTAAVAGRVEGSFVSVRFGNVLGSRGSILGAFREQIAKGGPVTVTDSEVTRYFMSIEEACGLVIQAGAIGRSGEALVLDMGTPVRIADFAQRLIDEAGRDIAIEFTGLRPGEKLHEDLFGDGEPDERPLHPLVSHVRVPVLHPGRLRGLDAYTEPHQVLAALEYLSSAPGLRAGESAEVIDLRALTEDPGWTDALLAAQGHTRAGQIFDLAALPCERHRRGVDVCVEGTCDDLAERVGLELTP